jgi:hypothetical protein
MDSYCLKEVCQWALAKPGMLCAQPMTKAIEKQWGNKIINQEENTQWTTKLGESFVFELLKMNGESPRRPKTINRYKPDIECDNFIYEVKTRNWSTTGTAGEKVLGAPFKYLDIPKLYGKPLKIICVAYQEYELTNGPTPVFDNVRPMHTEILEMYRNKYKIEYMKCSDLIKKLKLHV